VPFIKIVVVGGGVSGLTCAVALLEAGSGVFWSWGCAAAVVALCSLS
jgi:glycine/D-amino acid oxidase-like deaminating enzyme